MSISTPVFVFARGLYLDRRRARYVFDENKDTVLVVNAHEGVQLEDLVALFHPYQTTEVADEHDMFGADVLEQVRAQEARWLEGEPPEPPLAPPRPPPEAAAPASEAAPPAPAGPAATEPSAPSGHLASLGSDFRDLPPAAQAHKVADYCESSVRGWLRGPGGAEAVFNGSYDQEIQDVITGLCKELKPRHLLLGQPEEGRQDAGDLQAARSTRSAVTSQAFGAQLELDDLGLFLLAKSAIFQSLSRTGYQNIMEIKRHLLLRGRSPSLEKKLALYYRAVVQYLESRRVDREAVRLIDESKFIYLHASARDVDPRALALAAADAFVVLKEARQRTIEILDVLPPVLRNLLPPAMIEEIERAERLLRDTCYNEFRQAADSSLSGGDHCDFFSIGPNQRVILIFDVSGHEERASTIRDVLVDVVARLPHPAAPGAALRTLNRFCLKYPLPDDVFVSMVYGVLDAAKSTLIYANAGHHPPYLVRDEKIIELDDTDDLALNILDVEYGELSVSLQPADCLVFYTDGLIEAVSKDAMEADGLKKDFFGKDRLEQAILKKRIYARRASDAVGMILAAAKDEGFRIEDDITVQVYRHV